MSPAQTISLFKCLLLQLPVELLQEILIASDPEDVLRMEKTCKTLLLSSDSKVLWMALLAKLNYDQAPDVGPHVDLDSLLAKEVKRIVVRALRGYNNWCSPGGPRITRVQELHLRTKLRIMKILPGCQYIAVRSDNFGYYGVWDIKRERVIAKYRLHQAQGYMECDCELLRGGKIVRIAFERKDQDVFRTDRNEVVDFDLECGQANLRLSEDVENVLGIPGLSRIKVKEGMTLAQERLYIAILSPETGKNTRVKVDYDFVYVDIQMDIAHGALICLVTNRFKDGEYHLFVTKLSRISECAQSMGPIMLKDICASHLVLPISRVGLSYDLTMSVCDPLLWGSEAPCRILFSHLAEVIPTRSQHDQATCMKVHRLYLRDDPSGSEPTLSHVFSSECIPLESCFHAYYGFNLTSPSIAGHWAMRSRLWCYEFMLSKVWENSDDVRLLPSRRSDPKTTQILEIEYYSGTQIWKVDDGRYVLQFFD